MNERQCRERGARLWKMGAAFCLGVAVWVSIGSGPIDAQDQPRWFYHPPKDLGRFVRDRSVQSPDGGPKFGFRFEHRPGRIRHWAQQVYKDLGPWAQEQEQEPGIQPLEGSEVTQLHRFLEQSALEHLLRTTTDTALLFELLASESYLDESDP
jgi:hypothetical protein